MPRLNIFYPRSNTVVTADQPFSVSGEATDRGMPEPILIESVTVVVDDQPLINAHLQVIPDAHLTRRSFKVMVHGLQPGPHTIVVTATNDNGISTTQNMKVWVAWWDGTVPLLQKVSITFNTHNDDKDGDTVLHVFVKNRSNTSSTPEQATDFMSNLLAFQRCEEVYWDKNPYLACAVNLAPGMHFDDPSSHEFDIPLRSAPIPRDEIVLPVINIHILANGHDRWIFSYAITFYFDDGSSFQALSDTDGVTGIILDQNNRNYSGICIENPFKSLPRLEKPAMDAVLTEVTLKFYTHDDDQDDNKNKNTKLNVHIVNRLSSSSRQDIAIGLDLFHNQEFKIGSISYVGFGNGGLRLASDSIRLEDMVLPVVSINIAPHGHDRWIFDYEVTFEFRQSPGTLPSQKFSFRRDGVILDQDNHKHVSVYQGRPFPEIVPPGHPPMSVPDQSPKTKSISLIFLKSKIEEFVNKRQGTGLEDPPILKLRLDNGGKFGSAFPESYYDLQNIDTKPPPPVPLGKPPYPNSKLDFWYNSAAVSLDQIYGEQIRGLFRSSGIGQAYFSNLDSKMVKVTLDSTKSTPLTAEVLFDFSKPGSGIGGWQADSLSLQISLSLAVDTNNHVVDVLSWVPNVHDSDPMGFIDVHLGSSSSLAGHFEASARQTIFKELTKPDRFDGKTTLRDRLNIHFTSWLVGGLVGYETASDIKVQDVKINGDNLEIVYTGPATAFAPPVPQSWPSGTDFSRGNLANIEHIVVLTMENRSFDTMLGYLSLPLDKGGMGRKDVDGLKGSEVNLLNGKVCPSAAFAEQDTIFTPAPPHGYEPVHKAINGGQMDGFVESFARMDERGPFAAPRIMGYHTAVNVPVYDRLARDFAICHRWFAPHPGPTFCNRFYELTGMLNTDAEEGFWEFDNSSRLRPVFTQTIFDYLNDPEVRVSWKYFEHHYCFLRFFQAHTFDSSNIVAFDDPLQGFEVLARTGNLPNVSFIDPHFIELPPGANDDDAPADIKEGQKLVERVVNAVVSSPQWNNTLLIIIYDEHGGFYDHVPPPRATKVSPEDETLPNTYGVRVPAFVISPWVKEGAVFGHDSPIGGIEGALHFDHTSILKTIVRTFMSTKPPYMGPRYAAANDLSSVIGNESRPSQFRPFIAYNFLYVASQKRLEVQNAGVTPGTALLQSDSNDTSAQQFSFEYAVNGYWYIRTLTGSLYVTANDSLGIIQDVKYPMDGISTAANNPDQQRWKFTSGITVLDRNNFMVSNAAYPGKALQPADNSNDSGVPVVLDELPAAIADPPNPWQVTSSLLPNE